MRPIRPLLALVAFLAACGGGTGSPHLATTGVRTTGTVLAVDGATTALAQVSVGAPEADVWVSCDAQGRFDLGRLPAMEMTIHVAPDGRPAIEMPADLRGCTAVDLRLEVRGDRFTRAEMERCGAEHGTTTVADMDDMDGMGGMGGMDGDGMGGMGGMMDPEDPAPCGTARMSEDDAGHMGLTVEVHGLDPGVAVEVVLLSATGEPASLGVHVADADGTVRASWDGSAGEPLPFGATYVHDLAGVTVEARDAGTGEVLYVGTLPEVGPMRDGC